MCKDDRAECGSNGNGCLLIEVCYTERRVVSPGKDVFFAMSENVNLPGGVVPSICIIPLVVPIIETFVGQVVRVNRSLLDESPNERDQEVEEEEKYVHEQVLVGGCQSIKREVQEEDWKRNIGGHNDHYLSPWGNSEI